jgi:hypothetical protein
LTSLKKWREKMSHKKVSFTLLIEVLAILALSVNIALAGSHGADDLITHYHPPTCARVDNVPAGVVQLECLDAGKDIVEAVVKSDAQYDLRWDETNVVIRVFFEKPGQTATWIVKDKVGSVIMGTLP